jgi:chromate reductase, NAD(P)H dehydrogenase (quinone)
MKKVLAICGSIKQDSANHKLIQYIQTRSAGLFEIELFEGLTALPYFDPNPEQENSHESVNQFRKRIALADGVLVCTPEYVFSLPGILKNALEWTVSTTVFTDKPAALITASSSGKVAHESLQLVMKTLGVKTSDETRILISGIKSKMNPTGLVHDEETQKQLADLVKAFSSLLDHI